MSSDKVATTIRSQINRTDSAIYDATAEMRQLEQDKVDIAVRINALKLVLARLQGEMKALKLIQDLYGADHEIEVDLADIQC